MIITIQCKTGSTDVQRFPAHLQGLKRAYFCVCVNADLFEKLLSNIVCPLNEEAFGNVLPGHGLRFLRLIG